jgi:hypothetical protein
MRVKPRIASRASVWSRTPVEPDFGSGPIPSPGRRPSLGRRQAVPMPTRDRAERQRERINRDSGPESWPSLAGPGRRQRSRALAEPPIGSGPLPRGKAGLRMSRNRTGGSRGLLVVAPVGLWATRGMSTNHKSTG